MIGGDPVSRASHPLSARPRAKRSAPITSCRTSPARTWCTSGASSTIRATGDTPSICAPCAGNVISPPCLERAPGGALWRLLRATKRSASRSCATPRSPAGSVIWCSAGRSTASSPTRRRWRSSSQACPRAARGASSISSMWTPRNGARWRPTPAGRCPGYTDEKAGGSPPSIAMRRPGAMIACSSRRPKRNRSRNWSRPRGARLWCSRTAWTPRTFRRRFAFRVRSARAARPSPSPAT